MISLLTAFLVERLYESSHRQQNAAISLVQIEEEINEEQIGEYEAIIEGKLRPKSPMTSR